MEQKINSKNQYRIYQKEKLTIIKRYTKLKIQTIYIYIYKFIEQIYFMQYNSYKF